MARMVFGILFSLSALSMCYAASPRVAGSPYPVSTPPTTLYPVRQSAISAGQYLMMVSLSGVVAQTNPSLFVIPNGDDGTGANFWLNLLNTKFKVNINTTYQNTNNLTALVRMYLPLLKGYNLCNTVTYSNEIRYHPQKDYYKYRQIHEVLAGDTSVLNGWAVSGVNHGLLVTPDLQSFAQGLGLTLLDDVRSMTSQSVWSKYSTSFSKTTLIYQDPSKYGFLGDYGTFTHSFAFNISLTDSFATTVFNSLQKSSALLGWGQENDLVSVSSQHAVYVHAADWALNLPVFTNIEVPTFTQVKLPTVTPTAKHTVAFLFSDGDNVQWMINSFATVTNWYGSPNRGKIPLGWTVTPALSELAPNIMDYIYSAATNTSTGSDTFVAAPSGQGYMYPMQYTDNSGYASMLAKYLPRADLRILNIIDNGNTANVSSNVSYYSALSNVDGIIYYQYTDYSLLKGAISWSNNKPVVGGRMNLGLGNTPQQVADTINNLAATTAGHTASSPSAYSLIPVIVWSATVADVITTAGLFNSANVRVVSPAQLIQLIKDNVAH